jgi:hypothetical protein
MHFGAILIDFGPEKGASRTFPGDDLALHVGMFSNTFVIVPTCQDPVSDRELVFSSIIFHKRRFVQT